MKINALLMVFVATTCVALSGCSQDEELSNQIKALESKLLEQEAQYQRTLLKLERQHDKQMEDLQRDVSLCNEGLKKSNARVNELNNKVNSMKVEKSLSKPAEKAKTTPQPHKEYVVKLGDTFYNIAREHNLTREELSKLNPNIEDTSKLSIGEVVNIR